MMKSWRLHSVAAVICLVGSFTVKLARCGIGLRAKLDRRDNNVAAAKQPGQLQQCAGATTCISPANRATART